ncbi:hypothetical protein K525DRAFT_283979 [Schizophyllum commune Loenen D]|nr:hypothetical protein K525DRAFT_283979 [Schizophyllum commune Loenen D]
MHSFLIHKAVDIFGLSHLASMSLQDRRSDGRVEFLGAVNQRDKFSSLPVELLEMIFMNLSPRDLVSVRPVCTGFNALASKPRIRNAARENLLGLPKPETYNGELLSDSKFAMIVFTTSPRKPHIDHPRYNIWVGQYETAWKARETAIKQQIALFARWDANSKEKSLSLKDVVRRTRLYMRMPACITLFEAFRRDLEVIDYASWSLALPTILRQVNQVGAGDISNMPEGFMLAEEDKVVCPACAAESEGSGQSATYYERADQVRPWRRDESRIEVKGLYDHYVARHPDLVPPSVPNLFVGCELCHLKSQTYSGPGILAHKRHVHGVVNPAT